MTGMVEPVGDRACSFSKCSPSSSSVPGTFVVVNELEKALLSWRWHWSRWGGGTGRRECERLGKIHSDEDRCSKDMGSRFESDFGLQGISR